MKFYLRAGGAWAQTKDFIHVICVRAQSFAPVLYTAGVAQTLQMVL